jgi:hypothetical protein
MDTPMNTRWGLTHSYQIPSDKRSSAAWLPAPLLLESRLKSDQNSTRTVPIAQAPTGTSIAPSLTP